jgi:BlaI family transcriptional regulator, penicillinase repressor
MADRPALSKGEMEVARVLWQLGRATVRQVHEAFPVEREIDFTTVQTYLRRLETKGYVKAKLDGRTLIYSGRVEPRKVIGQAVDDLVDRLFGGEALPLMQHLIEEGSISESELASLRLLIDRLENEEPRDAR